MESYKYKLSPLFHETLVKWSEKQPNPKPSMSRLKNELNDNQKEADRMIGEMTEQSRYNKAADNLIGYTTLKLKVLQVAAQELLDVWKVNGDTDEYARLAQAVGHLAEAMKQTTGGHNK